MPGREFTALTTRHHRFLAVILKPLKEVEVPGPEDDELPVPVDLNDGNPGKLAHRVIDALGPRDVTGDVNLRAPADHIHQAQTQEAGEQQRRDGDNSIDNQHIADSVRAARQAGAAVVR